MLVSKTLDFEFKVHDEGKRETIGVLSTNEIDRQNDRTDQKTLGTALGAFIKRSGIVVWQHDWYSGGIGRLVDYDSSDGKTLVRIRYGSGYKLFGGVTVDDVWKQIEQGIVRTHSFGFAADRKPAGIKNNGIDVYDLFVSDVYELSVVTVPANASATMEAVKQYIVRGGSLPMDRVAAAFAAQPAAAVDERAQQAQLDEALRAMCKQVDEATAALRAQS